MSLRPSASCSRSTRFTVMLLSPTSHDCWRWVWRQDLAICVEAFQPSCSPSFLPLLLLAAMRFSFVARSVADRLLRYAGALVVVAAVALTMLWACYGFRYSARPGGAAVWSPPRLPVAHGCGSNKGYSCARVVARPTQAYLVGLQDVVVGSEVGDRRSCWASSTTAGKWFYFPVAAAIKYTLPVLLMVVVSLLSWSFWRSQARGSCFSS